MKSNKIVQGGLNLMVQNNEDNTNSLGSSTTNNNGNTIGKPSGDIHNNSVNR